MLCVSNVRLTQRINKQTPRAGRDYAYCMVDNSSCLGWRRVGRRSETIRSKIKHRTTEIRHNICKAAYGAVGIENVVDERVG